MEEQKYKRGYNPIMDNESYLLAPKEVSEDHKVLFAAFCRVYRSKFSVPFFKSAELIAVSDFKYFRLLFGEWHHLEATQRPPTGWIAYWWREGKTFKYFELKHWESGRLILPVGE